MCLSKVYGKPKLFINDVLKNNRFAPRVRTRVLWAFTKQYNASIAYPAELRTEARDLFNITWQKRNTPNYI